MTLTLEVAGVRLDVACEGAASELVASLSNLYPRRTVRAALELRLLPHQAGTSRPGVVEIVEGDSLERLSLSYSLSGQIDLNHRIAKICLDPVENGVLSALRLAFSVVALRENVLWLHSLGVVHEGQTYLFAGTSGSGKSTLGRSVSGDSLLADESIAVRWDDERPVACSTPFQSAGHQPPPHREGDLAAIHLLARGARTTIRPLTRIEGLVRIWRCVFSLERSARAQELALALASRLVEAVAVRELAFTLEPHVVHRAINNEARTAEVAP